MLQKKWFCCPYIMHEFCSKCSYYSCGKYNRSQDEDFKNISKDKNLKCDIDKDNTPEEKLNDSREDLDIDIYLDAFRAPQTDIDRLLGLLSQEQPDIYKQFKDYGVDRRTSNYLLRLIIGYVIDNAEKYSGSENQRVNAISKDFEKRYSSALSSVISMGIPRNRLNEIIKKVIKFTLNNME